MTKYIPEAMGYPTCQRVISRYILQAEALLRDAIFTNSIPSLATPPVLYTVLYKNAGLEAEKWIQDLKLRAITTVHSKLSHLPDLPSIDQFLNATLEHPLQWRPRLLQLDGQTDASFYEKSTALEFLLTKVDAYIQMDSNPTMRLHTILHGSPGTGKTFLALCTLLYAVGQGLFSIVTSIPSKRSRECGGIHLAQLLKMCNHSNVSGRSDSTQYSADDILCNLFKHPISLNVIRVLSFLLLEEGGLFNAEIITTMSSVCSYARNCPVYFGGIMTLTTMDIEQLRSIDGHPLLMSPNVLVAYDIICLKHFVRSRDDPDLQRLLEIMTNWNERKRHHELEFERILKRHVHFVHSFDDPSITPSHMRVFSKHVAVEQAEKDFVDRYIKGNHQITMLIRKAIDEESERKSFHFWEEAGKHAKVILNRATKLQEKLLLYDNMKVAMTYNEPGVFDQGQLAIVKLHTLTQRDIDNWVPIHLLISAIGTTVPPTNFQSMTDSDFFEQGWTEVYVKKITSEQKSVNFTRIARRSQYPFLPQNATTTHKIIGDTLPLLVTRVDDVPSSPYYIWEKGATVVVLSRSEKLKQIIIVSPKGADEAIRVLKSTLSKTDDYYLYTKDIINRHAITFEQVDTNAQVIREPALPVHRLRHFPYRAIDNAFPEKGAVLHGFLYLLLSKSKRLQEVNTCKIYIGETDDIRHRLNVHNSGCCNTADPSYRPWVPLVYFTGFESSTQRKSLEQKWQNQAYTYERHHFHLIDCITYVNDIISIGKALCEDETQKTKANVTMHQCFVNP
jgi:predicted GIY-YIG superfamily endonuclease